MLVVIVSCNFDKGCELEEKKKKRKEKKRKEEKKKTFKKLIFWLHCDSEPCVENFCRTPFF